MDFKSLASKIPNFKTDRDGCQVYFTKIRFDSSKPYIMFYTVDLEQELCEIDLWKGVLGRRRKQLNQHILKLLNICTRPIADAKFNDLMDLCNSLAISRQYHKFFSSPPHSGGIDRLPLPNFDKEEEDECVGS